MSILKALQKKKAEQANHNGNGNGNGNGTGRSIVSDQDSRKKHLPPDLFGKQSNGDGNSNRNRREILSSVFNEQADSEIGKALPDLETKNTAGATLNAVGSTHSTDKILPEFTEWEIEAERVEPRLVAIKQPHSSYCEEYRSLRTHIFHKNQKKRLQSIVVASVNPSEGKSITALNLSWLLAQTDGVTALLIDSDLRMPSLTDYLGIETDKGLSHILSERATLKDSIIKLQPSGLHLLPGGEARSDVAEMISGRKFKDILTEAREMFDYIIVDAPPLGIFTDATLLINHADGALFVVRAGKTRYSAIDRVLEPIPRDRMLGVVLNQSEDVLEESHYTYGYYNSARRFNRN